MPLWLLSDSAPLHQLRVASCMFLDAAACFHEYIRVRLRDPRCRILSSCKLRFCRALDVLPQDRLESVLPSQMPSAIGGLRPGGNGQFFAHEGLFIAGFYSIAQRVWQYPKVRKVLHRFGSTLTLAKASIRVRSFSCTVETLIIASFANLNAYLGP